MSTTLSRSSARAEPADNTINEQQSNNQRIPNPIARPAKKSSHSHFVMIRVIPQSVVKLHKQILLEHTFCHAINNYEITKDMFDIGFGLAAWHHDEIVNATEA